MNHCPVIIQMTLKQVLSITQVPLSPLIMNYILCGMGKTRLSTTLRKIQKLRGKKKKHMRQHGVVSCKTPGNAGDYFYWKAMKSKYYHYRTSPGLFSSFHYYCTASSAIVFVNTIGRTLQPVGDSVNWDLPCEYWCFGELCPGGLGRACHSERHFILCIVISFAAEFKSVIAFVVRGRSKH